MSALSLHKRAKGRPSAEQTARFDADLDLWCAAIKEINSRLDFRVSSRGWCYILEEKGGLLKGDFDIAQARINKCRKSGRLPLDICSDDDGRAADGLEDLDVANAEERAADLIYYITVAHRSYDPISFWETQPKYIEMATEKIDLKSLFALQYSGRWGLCPDTLPQQLLREPVNVFHADRPLTWDQQKLYDKRKIAWLNFADRLRGDASAMLTLGD